MASYLQLNISNCSRYWWVLVASTFPAAMGGRRRCQAIFGHGWRVAICLTVRVSMDYYALKREKRPAFGLAQCLHFRQRRAPESKKTGIHGWCRLIPENIYIVKERWILVLVRGFSHLELHHFTLDIQSGDAQAGEDLAKSVGRAWEKRQGGHVPCLLYKNPNHATK